MVFPGLRRVPFLGPAETGVAPPVCWQIDLDDPSLEPLCAMLSADERERAARFARPVLAQRHRRAHGALRHLLGLRVGQDGGALRFETNAHGKPALRGPGPWFNLSHSDRHALVAISDDVPVGVDIEALRPIDDADGWASAQLSPRERAQWRAVPPAQRSEAFLHGWTRKEAALKALGVGLSVDDAALVDVGLRPRGGAVALARLGASLRWLGPLLCSGPVVASLALAESIVS